MYIKTFEEFNPFNLKGKLDQFSQTAMNIVEKYDDLDLDIDLNTPQISSLKDLYNIIKSAPSELVNFCKRIYSENQEEVDKLATEFKSGIINEEMCILTFLSLCLLVYMVWANWPAIKKKFGYDNGGRAGLGGAKMTYFNKFKDRHNVSNYASMSQEQLKKQADDALDRGDYDKLKEISKYLED